MNLIIQASLSEQPTDSLAFRYVTCIAKDDFNLDILLLTEKELKDLYYFNLKKRGMFDYIDYLLTPAEKEYGIKITNEKNNYKYLIYVRGFF